MINPKLLRNNLDETAANLARRGFNLDTNAMHGLESSRKQKQIEVEVLRARHKTLSKRIGTVIGKTEK